MASVPHYHAIACDVGPLSNYSIFENNTEFTLDQFNQYVQICSHYMCRVIPALKMAGSTSFAVSGAVGLVAFLFMFATLMHVSINGCTLIYHKATVLLEIVHMVIMIQHGIVAIHKPQIPNSWMSEVWFSQMRNGWVIGDSIKLAVSFLTTFLTVERFMAIWFPFVFKKFNKNWIAYMVTIISLCIGSAHLWAIGIYEVVLDQKQKNYVRRSTAFSASSIYDFIPGFIYATKVGLSVIIFVLCLAIAVRLKIVAKKAWAMNSKAKEDWLSKKKACTLTYILGISILFDHVMWVSYKVYKHRITDNGGEKDIRLLSYNEALADIEQAKVRAILELGQRLMGQVVHSWRFFLYLAFNRTMRDGLMKLFSKRATPGTVSAARVIGVSSQEEQAC